MSDPVTAVPGASATSPDASAASSTATGVTTAASPTAANTQTQTPPSMVPLQALHAERAKNRTLQQQLATQAQQLESIQNQLLTLNNRPAGNGQSHEDEVTGDPVLDRVVAIIDKRVASRLAPIQQAEELRKKQEEHRQRLELHQQGQKIIESVKDKHISVFRDQRLGRAAGHDLMARWSEIPQAARSLEVLEELASSVATEYEAMRNELKTSGIQTVTAALPKGTGAVVTQPGQGVQVQIKEPRSVAEAYAQRQQARQQARGVPGQS